MSSSDKKNNTSYCNSRTVPSLTDPWLSKLYIQFNDIKYKVQLDTNKLLQSQLDYIN